MLNISGILMDSDVISRLGLSEPGEWISGFRFIKSPSLACLFAPQPLRAVYCSCNGIFFPLWLPLIFVSPPLTSVKHTRRRACARPFCVNSLVSNSVIY